MNYKLTIAIPTYNRSRYLKELLPEIKRQHSLLPENTLEVLIIDNASTDDTPEYIKSNHQNTFRYIRNSSNIGADRNFIECIRQSTGEYVWLYGDDEILKPDGVNTIINLLDHKPDFIIAESDIQETTKFSSYTELLRHFDITDPIFPVHHTLITKNIFPRSGFDLEFAFSMMKTNYTHMYGLVNQLKKSKCIYILSKPESAFSVRDERAPFADPPLQLEKKLVELNAYIADQIGYKKLKTNAWLYFNSRPLYNLFNSRKIKRLIRKLMH